MKKPDTTILPG
jgi:hypothetical protein